MNVEFLISSSLRSHLLRAFPALESSCRLRALFAFVVLGARFDHDSDLPLICWRDLAASASSSAHDLSISKLRKQFCREVFPISLSQPSRARGKCHQLEHMEAPSWLLRAIDDDRPNLASAVVELVSGRLVDPLLLLRDHRQEVHADLSRLVDTHGRIVFDYLNTRDHELFEVARSRVHEAQTALRDIENPIVREQQRRILRCCQIQPVPIYRPVELSDRAYAVGSSFLHLKRSLRGIVTQDWAKLDLKQAQLRIVSKLWDAPTVELFLAQSQHPWIDLLKLLRASAASKDELKTAIYSLCFGASVQSLRKQLDSAEEGLGDRFLSLGYVAELVTARDRLRRRVLLDGYLEAAGGRRMQLTAVGRQVPHQLRSLLARQAQSYEFAVMRSVVEYAISTEHSTNPLRVLAWLHDGVWVDCPDSSKLQIHVDAIQAVVNRTAQQLLQIDLPLDAELSSQSIVNT